MLRHMTRIRTIKGLDPLVRSADLKKTLFAAWYTYKMMASLVLHRNEERPVHL